MESPFRIASRVEGKNINFYLAVTGTMEGAELLMSVNRAFLDHVGWEKFKELAVEGVSKLMAEKGIKTGGWYIQEAPQNERSGHS